MCLLLFCFRVLNGLLDLEELVVGEFCELGSAALRESPTVLHAKADEQGEAHTALPNR